MHKFKMGLLAALCTLGSLSVNATLVSITNCTGANDCVITTTPPNPVLPDPNDGILLAWDEMQNVKLTEDLRVDRVFDTSVDFIEVDGTDFLIKAGTVVSSHYIQWDPGNNSLSTVSATINLDSQVFAFITADQNLFDSDAVLGLPWLDYNDFRYRGLEYNDITTFSGENTDIRWQASSPGDWARLITAYSPGATVPEPSTLLLLGAGIAGLGFATRRKKA